MKTKANRKLFKDPKTGEIYSERTVTVPTWYGWVTTPTVDANGQSYSAEGMRYFLEHHGPIDFLTGERLPVFSNEVEASKYAKERSALYNEDAQLFSEGLLD